MQQNKSTLVQSLLMTLSQETRWAYCTRGRCITFLLLSIAQPPTWTRLQSHCFT